jgi:hypothetical protein
MSKSCSLASGWPELLFLVIVACLSSADRLLAEEMLHKKQARYLGWQTAKDKFTACDKTVIKIEDGKVEKTDRKCKRPNPPPLGRPPEVGIVRDSNTRDRTITLETKDGRAQTFFYPNSNEEAGGIPLEQVRAGHKVIVSSPVAGRAESIKPFSSPAKRSDKRKPN